MRLMTVTVRLMAAQSAYSAEEIITHSKGVVIRRLKMELYLD